MSNQKMIETFRTVPYHNRLGVDLKELEANIVKLHLPFKEVNSNFGGALHGGIAGSLVNIAAQQLAVAHVEGPPDDYDLTVVSQDVQYLSAAISEPIEAIGTVLRRGKELTFISVDVLKQQNKPVARGMVTVRCVSRETDSKTENPSGLTKEAFYSGPCDPGPIAGVFMAQPFIGDLGLHIEHVKDNMAIVKMPFQKKMSGRHGSYHEGVLSALIDTTGALAAWSTVPLGMHKASTPSIHVNFLAREEDKAVYALARIRWRREELFLIEVHIVGADSGKIFADGTVVYRIVVRS